MKQSYLREDCYKTEAFARYKSHKQKLWKSNINKTQCITLSHPRPFK